MIGLSKSDLPGSPFYLQSFTTAHVWLPFLASTSWLQEGRAMGRQCHETNHDGFYLMLMLSAGITSHLVASLISNVIGGLNHTEHLLQV